MPGSIPPPANAEWRPALPLMSGVKAARRTVGVRWRGRTFFPLSIIICGVLWTPAGGRTRRPLLFLAHGGQHKQHPRGPERSLPAAYPSAVTSTAWCGLSWKTRIISGC